VDEAEGKHRQEEKSSMKRPLQDIIDQTMGAVSYFTSPDELREIVIALAEEARELDAVSREALKLMAARALRQGAEVKYPERILDAAFNDE